MPLDKVVGTGDAIVFLSPLMESCASSRLSGSSSSEPVQKPDKPKNGFQNWTASFCGGFFWARESKSRHRLLAPPADSTTGRLPIETNCRGYQNKGPEIPNDTRGLIWGMGIFPTLSPDLSLPRHNSHQTFTGCLMRLDCNLLCQVS